MPVGFYFDMTRCTGCRACQLACKDRNRLEPGMTFRRAKTYSVGSFPQVKGYSVSASCNHCQNAPCVVACPVGAMRKADDGTVFVEQEACVGCRRCVRACPYDQVHIRSNGKAGKCDGCRALRDGGERPACVAACPTRALDFGPIEELSERYGPNLVSSIVVVPDAATGSTTLIKAKATAFEKNPREVRW